MGEGERRTERLVRFVSLRISTGKSTNSFSERQSSLKFVSLEMVEGSVLSELKLTYVSEHRKS